MVVPDVRIGHRVICAAHHSGCTVLPEVHCSLVLRPPDTMTLCIQPLIVPASNNDSIRTLSRRVRDT